MKKVLFSIALSLFSVQTFAACTDLSGTYLFRGLKGGHCRGLNLKSETLTPLPLTSMILEGDTVQITQQGCESIKLAYLDKLHGNPISNAEEKIDLTQEQVTEAGFSHFEKSHGTDCAMGGCLSTKDKKAWSLSLTKEGHLRFNYRSSMVGFYDFIVPVIDITSMHCTLERI